MQWRGGVRTWICRLTLFNLKQKIATYLQNRVHLFFNFILINLQDCCTRCSSCVIRSKILLKSYLILLLNNQHLMYINFCVFSTFFWGRWICGDGAFPQTRFQKRVKIYEKTDERKTMNSGILFLSFEECDLLNKLI